MASSINGQFLTYDPKYSYADVTDAMGSIFRRDIISSGRITFSGSDTTSTYTSISPEELAELKDDSKLLYALIDAGVEDWEGYKDALAIWRERQ